MTIVLKIVFIVLLFLFVYTSFYVVLDRLFDRFRRSSRLNYVKRKFSFQSKFTAIQSHRGYQHITTLLASTNLPLQPIWFIYCSTILILIGIIGGYFIFHSIRGMVLLSLFLGTVPYLILRLRLLNIQMRTRLEFLPAVEVFYQCYVLSYHKNVRVVLGGIIEEQRIMYPLRPAFEQLHRHLATHDDLDYSLNVFNMTLGHVWGDYFINILKLGITEGVDITSSLHELVADMRKAKRSDQIEKNRLLEIRIANFSPMLFLAVFLMINFKMNKDQAIHYYLVLPEGRELLLDALFMIFLSFVMGVVLSIKRM